MHFFYIYFSHATTSDKVLYFKMHFILVNYAEASALIFSLHPSDPASILRLPHQVTLSLKRLSAQLERKQT